MTPAPPLPLRREDWPADMLEDHAERAAIIEAEGVDRKTAERRAALVIRARWAKFGR